MSEGEPDARRPVYPFVALVGQESMKEGLLLCAIDPRIGGFLIMGHRGTAKTTAVRGLAELLPKIPVVKGCPFPCDPEEVSDHCDHCHSVPVKETVFVPVPLVDLPLGATEDRVAGTLDLEAALVRGRRRFDPGLLAAAHRGFLYIDEVNLLEDHLVDLLLDVAAGGENVVERESVSVRHPSRFVLVGTGNPEEGDLRPQLMDRFGLSAEVTTETDPKRRVEIVRRRLAFEDDPLGFRAQHAGSTADIRNRLVDARGRLLRVQVSPEWLEEGAALCAELGLDGHRGELTLVRAARARAAWEGRDRVSSEDLHQVAPLALGHRLRKDPLDSHDRRERVMEAVARRQRNR